MTSKRNATLEQREKLIRKFRIQSYSERRGSTAFDKWFNDIEKLNRVRFDNYIPPVELRPTEAPWRDGIRSRAEDLASKADEAFEEGVNEFTWRLRVENDIFERFKTEVTCKRGGICPLFSFRAGQKVQHDQEVAKHIPKGEMPDRVYGLKPNRRIKKLLADVMGEEIDDDPHKFSPFKTTRDNPIFPFLVFESKSAKNLSDHREIFLQTAFVIRTLLNLQKSLRDTNGPNRTQWEEGPLVWFFSHRGPDWQLSAAYMANESTVYRVVDLWNGNIRRKSNALRLLLIVDYIVDWAREIYRRDIITELNILVRVQNPDAPLQAYPDQPSLPETRSDADDKQIELMGNYMDSMVITPDTRASSRAALNISHLLELFDCGEHAIRDASYMHHNLYGIFITLSDVNDLLNSVKTPRASVTLARRLLKYLPPSDACCITTDSLAQIEELWSGQERSCTEWQSDPGDKIIVRFCFNSYLEVRSSSPSQWQQVHDLSFVAMTEAAMDSLRISANLQRRRSSADLDKFPEVDLDDLREFFREQRHAPVKECLQRAIDSKVIRTTTEMASHDTPQIRILVTSEATDAVQGIQSIAFQIYEAHVVGRKDPSEKYIHVLRHFGKQIETRASDSGPLRRTSVRQHPGATSVAATGFHKRKVGSYCLFLHPQTEAGTILLPTIQETGVIGSLSTLSKVRYFAKQRISIDFNTAASTILDVATHRYDLVVDRKNLIRRSPVPPPFMKKVARYLEDKSGEFGNTSRLRTLEDLSAIFDDIGTAYELRDILETLKKYVPRRADKTRVSSVNQSGSGTDESDSDNQESDSENQGSDSDNQGSDSDVGEPDSTMGDSDFEPSEADGSDSEINESCPETEKSYSKTDEARSETDESDFVEAGKKQRQEEEEDDDDEDD